MARSRRYFGTDGIRGKVGRPPITADFMLKLGWAAGCVLAPTGGKVLIGKDTRVSGYMFESALEAGLSAAGVDIRLLGPMPTPAIAYLTQTLHARAGIVISASHNPYSDNGIKFFSGQGTKLADDQERRIEEHMERPMRTVSSRRLGKAERVEDAAGRYIEFCKSTIPSDMDLNGMKIVVDCAHGATYQVGPRVFEELGAQVFRLGTKPDGFNINRGCGSTDPEPVKKSVVQHHADLGVAFDGDGDRVIMVDHRSEVLDGDQLLLVIAEGRLEDGSLNGAVVGTVMSNLGLEEALNRQGVELKRSNVGDRHVLEMMRQGGSNLGGETSGHIICLDRISTGDGITAALQVIARVRRTGRTLHDLKQGMRKHPQVLVNVPVPEGSDVISGATVQEAVRDVETALNGHGRVLLRPSGTEPLIRVMVEGRDSAQVEGLARRLAVAVERAVSNRPSG